MKSAGYDGQNKANGGMRVIPYGRVDKKRLNLFKIS